MSNIKLSSKMSTLMYENGQAYMMRADLPYIGQDDDTKSTIMIEACEKAVARLEQIETIAMSLFNELIKREPSTWTSDEHMFFNVMHLIQSKDD